MVLKLKHLNNEFVLYKPEVFPLCRFDVDCRDAFISCFDSHSDGTHLLQRIQSDVMISLKMSTFSANCKFLDKLFFKYELDMEI